MRKIALLLLIILTILPQMPIAAQDDDSPLLEVITPDNIGRMQEIQRLGRGGLGTSTLSPNGQLLAVNTLYGIWLHDLSEPDLPPRLLDDSNRRGREMSFTSDGRFLISCCRNLGLWSTHTGEQLLDYQDILGIRITPFDSIRIEERNQDASYHIWDWETQKTIFSLPYSVNAQSQLDPTGQYVVRFDEILETKMAIWHVDTNQIIAYFNPRTQIQWIEGGEHILVTEPDSGKCYIYALDNMSVAFEWDTYASYNQFWSYDGIIYAVDRISGKFVVVDGTTWKVIEREIPDYVNTMQSHIAHNRGSIAWINFSERQIFIYDLQQQTDIRKYNYHRQYHSTPVLQFFSQTLVVTNRDTGHIDFYKYGDDLSFGEFRYPGQVETIIFKPDSEFLVSGSGSAIDPTIGSWDNAVDFWDIETGELIKEFDRHEGRVISLDFSADGNFLISTGLRDDTYVLRVQDIATIRSFPRTDTGVAMFSPRNHVIGALQRHGLSLIYHDLDISEAYPVPTGLVSRNFVFSNSGSMLANGNRIINLADGTVFLEFDYRIRFVAFSPDDKYFAVTTNYGHEGYIEVWDIEQLQPQLRVRVHQASTLWGYNPVYVSFSADGDLLATAGGGSLVVLDTRDWSIIYQAQRDARNLALSPDGKYLAVGLSDGTISIYGVPAE